MVDETVIANVKKYLAALPAVGIHAGRAVLFGSFAQRNAHKWSDIDLIVIAPEFDQVCNLSVLEQLWMARAGADDRIEPIPCGEEELYHPSEAYLMQAEYDEKQLAFYREFNLWLEKVRRL